MQRPQCHSSVPDDLLPQTGLEDVLGPEWGCEEAAKVRGGVGVEGVEGEALGGGAGEGGEEGEGAGGVGDGEVGMRDGVRGRARRGVAVAGAAGGEAAAAVRFGFVAFDVSDSRLLLALARRGWGG